MLCFYVQQQGCDFYSSRGGLFLLENWTLSGGENFGMQFWLGYIRSNKLQIHNVLLNPSRVLYSVKWSVYLYFCSSVQIQSYEEDDTLLLTYQACLGSFLGYTYDAEPLVHKAVRPHLGLEGLWGFIFAARTGRQQELVKALTMWRFFESLF